MQIQIHNQEHTCTQQKGSIKQNLLVFLLVLTGLVIFVAFMLPQSYPSDTTLIGKGKPSIVLIYDSNNAVSDEIMEGFSKVRGELEAKIEFILVDVNAPGGREFAEANAVSTASALFFDGKGSHITTIYTPLETKILKKSIQQIFSF